MPYNRFVFDAPLDATAADAQALPRYVFAPLSEIGVAAAFPQGRIANSYVLQDTVSYIRGRHTFRTGLDLLESAITANCAAERARKPCYLGPLRDIQAFANFLDDFSGSNGGASRDFGSPVYYPTYFRQAYFFQDRWQVNPGLHADTRRTL